ncbi:hypothetical protein Vretimale_2601 [Volvox reticuliferus]|uniref:Uncharacterized protein n=1 Tax=Volvox reticuliferus TaxID=1737510 RepID=A0A8J4FHA0_9CHLO|nr:hypothetical protein Vretifemale_4848 [Volvox reticuliferus]GIL96815.1 hypothetical protein Vretimale_2601 [Volvox reticuliferus]
MCNAPNCNTAPPTRQLFSRVGPYAPPVPHVAHMRLLGPNLSFRDGLKDVHNHWQLRLVYAHCEGIDLYNRLEYNLEAATQHLCVSGTVILSLRSAKQLTARYCQLA